MFFHYTVSMETLGLMTGLLLLLQQREVVVLYMALFSLCIASVLSNVKISSVQ